MERTLLNRRQFNRAALAGLGMFVGSQWTQAQPATVPTTAPAARRNDFTDVFAPQGLPFIDGSFTVVAIPDTQHYSNVHHKHFYNITKWIAENREKHNIQFVMHLGDITNNNLERQWEVARRAMSTLDGHVPYSVVCGNHDHGPNGKSADRSTMLNDYFKFDDYTKQPTFGGAREKGKIESAYHTFSAMGNDFLVLGLEWAPRDETIEWANEILAKHPNHRVLMHTHAYMYYNDTRYNHKKYGRKQAWSPYYYAPGRDPAGVNDGQDMWEKLASRHKNFLMTLNGHVLQDGLGRLTSKGEAGNDVHQWLVNYQNRWEGGEGYVRLIEFLPDKQTIQVKAFSPSTGLYKIDAQNQFTVAINPGLA